MLEGIRDHSILLASTRPQLKVRSSNGNSDILRQLHEYRDDLFTLNQSRLNALTELQAAKRRIKELEIRLEEATAQTAVPREAVQSLSATQATSDTSDAFKESPNQGEAADNGNLQSRNGDEANVQGVTIAYGTGWENAYIHYRTESQGWTEVPGQAMTPGSGELQGSKTATIQTSERIEFVLNNGENQWDSPDPYGGDNQNYIVERPGMYYLKSGKLQRLK